MLPEQNQGTMLFLILRKVVAADKYLVDCLGIEKMAGKVVAVNRDVADFPDVVAGKADIDMACDWMDSEGFGGHRESVGPAGRAGEAMEAVAVDLDYLDKMAHFSLFYHPFKKNFAD